MSKTYEIYSRGDEKCWLADTDTYTLALCDAAIAEIAENVEETTAQMLADMFDFSALVDLAIKIGSLDHHDKLTAAIRLAASMPDSLR